MSSGLVSVWDSCDELGLYLKSSIISSSLLSIASKSWERDRSCSEYEYSITGEEMIV